MSTVGTHAVRSTSTSGAAPNGIELHPVTDIIFDPATGTCSNPPKPDGTACNDGNACTQTESCQGGICVGVNPVVCTASDQCHTVGTCDPATGQCSNPAKTGNDAITCAFKKSVNPPSCASQSVPRSIQKKFTAADSLVSRALGKTGKARHRLLKKARAKLRQAIKLVNKAERRKKNPISSDCGSPIRDVLTDALNRLSDGLTRRGAPVEDARAEGAQWGPEGVEAVGGDSCTDVTGVGTHPAGTWPGWWASCPRRKPAASSAREPRRHKGFSAAR